MAFRFDAMTPNDICPPLHPRFWQGWQVEMLRRHYADSNTQALAAAIDRTVHQVHQKAASIGLAKSRELIAREARENQKHLLCGNKGAWKKGNMPWNAGLKGMQVHPNCRVHQFKAGELAGLARQLVMPVGAYRVNADGYLDRKFSNQPGQQTLRWRAAHRLVWEAAHGPVPPGHAVAFLPGRFSTDPERITLDALELITRQELIRRNSVHTRYPPELRQVVQLRGALTRQINRRAKRQDEATQPQAEEAMTP